MATHASMIRRIFKQAWDRYGRPMVCAIRPPSQWTNMPAGFTYDPVVDMIRNSAGRKLEDQYLYWDFDYIYVVPAQLDESVRVMMMTGVIPTGTIEVGVLGDDYQTLKQAFQVQVDSEWYDVVSIPRYPPATGTEWSRVQLRRRS